MKPYLVQIRPCVDERGIRRAVYRALQHGHPQLMPRQPQNVPLVIIASGPSAENYLDNIAEHAAQGHPIMTVAGMHNWLIERGIKPTYQAMMDPRERTAAYITPSHSEVTYLIASQCHEAVFDAVKGKNVFVWHVEGSAQERLILDAAMDRFVHIRTGCTIGMGALSLAIVLGHTKLHLYGYDGCFMGDKHHAHNENNTKAHKTVAVAGRTFVVDKWMGGQVSDWQKVLDIYKGQLDITMYGDGLLPHIKKLKDMMSPGSIYPGMTAEITLLEVGEAA